MSEESCHELMEGMKNRQWLGDSDALFLWLDGLSDVRECIAEGLQRALATEDWLSLDKLLIAADRHQSRMYAAVLCEVLRRRVDKVSNENVVDLLADLREPSSVPCLEEALEWRPPWDDYRHLAVKVVWALAAIGTEEALAVLRRAAQSDSERVRKASVEELEHMGR
jgi:HEAT repeat protein